MVMINTWPIFPITTAVVNGFSDLIVLLFGPNEYKQARSAAEVQSLPMKFPVIVEGMVEI
jgi:hypothetical protein